MLVLTIENKSIFLQLQGIWVSYPITFLQLLNLNLVSLKSLLMAQVEINGLVQLFYVRRFIVCTVSGGFATVQPGNLLSINAVEAYALEDFSPEAVRSGLADAQRGASGGGSEEEVAEARIEVEVYEALQVKITF